MRYFLTVPTLGLVVDDVRFRPLYHTGPDLVTPTRMAWVRPIVTVFSIFLRKFARKLVLLDEIFIRFHWTATVRTTFKRICN